MTTATPRRALLDTSVLIDFPAARVAAPDPLAQLHRRRRVQAALDRFEVLSFDASCAEYYGTLAALVRRHGRNSRARRLDLQIAATAVRYGLALLTHNATQVRVVDLVHHCERPCRAA